MELQASISSSPNFTNSSIDSIIEIYKELLKQLKKLRIEFTQSREDENIEMATLQKLVNEIEMIQSAAVQLNSQLHTLESRVHLLLQKI
jgi:predicted RecB family endonuclease